MRPWISLILATSLDGKLSAHRGARPGFPSKADGRHLEEKVSLADAVLLGAGTVRAYSTAFLVQDPSLLAQRIARGQRTQPLTILTTRTLDLDPEWTFFRQPMERMILTGLATPEQQARFSPLAQLLVCGGPEGVDFAQALELIHAQGIQHLALLGGGQIVAQFLALGLVDELWLTLCPVVIAGTDAPSLAEGQLLPEWTRARLVDLTQVADELFLHYRFDL